METKYDGERLVTSLSMWMKSYSAFNVYRRLQVHIDLSLPRDRQIKIFSKSGRDSTETRHLLHPFVELAILPFRSRLIPFVSQNYSRLSRSRHGRSFRISTTFTPRNSTPLSPSNLVFLRFHSTEAHSRR